MFEESLLIAISLENTQGDKIFLKHLVPYRLTTLQNVQIKDK